MSAGSVSIVVVDLADATLASVCDRLRSLARDHLIDDLFIVDINQVTPTETPAEVAGGGQEEDELYVILGRQSITTARVCAVAHPDLGGTEATTTIADAIFTHLKQLSPPGATLKSVRIWAGDDDEAGPPESFASPAIDANLAIIPEDRASGVQFGVPIRDVGLPLFAESLAVELATQLGLWVGMSNAPVDTATMGVIGYGSPKIHFVRSFVRIAAGPSVPIAPILVDGGRALLPNGCIETADPDRYIKELADRAEEILDPLGPTESQRPSSDRVERSIGSGLGTVGHAIADYVGVLPSRIARGTMEDLTELAGQVTQDIVGNSSIIEIVWRDQVDHDEPMSYGNLADRIAEDAQSQIDLRGGIASDQHMWLDLNGLVSGAIDGGPIPGLNLVGEDGLIPVISDVGRIVMGPQTTLDATIRTVLPSLTPTESTDADEENHEDDNGDTDPSTGSTSLSAERTLINRIETVINAYREGHTESLNERIRGMVEVLRSLRWGPPIGIAIGGGVAAFLGMLLIVEILIFSGLANGLGIYSMSGEARDLAWAIMSGLTVVGLLAAAYVGYRSTGQWTKVWPPILAAGLAATMGGVIAQAMETSGSDASSREIWGAATTLAVLVGAPALSVTLWFLGRSVRTAGQMARVAYVIWLVYFGFIIVGSVVRPGGWWDEDHGSLPIYLLLFTLSLFVTAIMVTGYLEFRYRYRLRSAIDEVAWFEKEIVSAVRSRAMTDEAGEQFKAFAATWSYIVWNPAGRVKGVTSGMPGLADMSLLKAGFLSFGLTERGEQELRNSTRNEISKTGWLKDQYELAVAAFQSDDAVRIGAPSRIRPDQDTRPIAAVPEERRSDVSARWRFAKAMLLSDLDYALLERFDELEPLNIYEDVLGDRRNLALADQGTSPMGEFFIALREGEDVEIPAGQLTVQGRMDTNLADRVLCSQVWWPEVDLPGVAIDGDTDRCELTTSRESVVVIAVRSDWAGPFVPSAVSELATPTSTATDDPDGGVSMAPGV